MRHSVQRSASAARSASASLDGSASGRALTIDIPVPSFFDPLPGTSETPNAP